MKKSGESERFSGLALSSLSGFFYLEDAGLDLRARTQLNHLGRVAQRDTSKPGLEHCEPEPDAHRISN